MPVAPGTTLGPYEIVAPIGAGGMGAVYRARDRRLQRDVAVKVMKADGRIDAAARGRFEREAQSIAALNHPHICAVFDVGAHQGTDYIVMELVEGETLAARLAHGPLSIVETLRYAVHMAGALDAAHRAGIVHRDLKPANVMLTRGGVKLLDFGLARSSPLPSSSDGATETSPAMLSEPGVLMGTWPYMAPEQILGQPVDARTDVFAFGIVLYEMLAGSRPFPGDSAPRIMAAILERDAPPLSIAAPAVPRALTRVIDKCLAKGPDARWQSMHDVGDALRWIQDDLDRPLETSGTPTQKTALPKRRRLSMSLGTATLAGLAGLAIGIWSRPPVEPAVAPATTRFTIAPNDLDVNDQSSPEVSPDGRLLAFVARPRAGGATALYLHDLASGSTSRLDGTDGAASPFWSGNGRSLGFVARSRLMRVDIAGGSPRALMDVANVFLGAAWSQDDVIVVSQRFGFYRMPAGGGEATQITALDRSRQENSHRWPQFLPDGQRFVFVARSGRPEKSSAYVGYLDGRPATRLMETTAQVRYAPSGHLLYVQDDTLMARALDLSSLAFDSDPIAIANDVQARGTGLRARFSLSATGVLAHQPLHESQFQLRWYDRSGNALGALGHPGVISSFRISPDGTRIVMDVDDNPKGGRSVWLLDAASGGRTRVTFGESDDWVPIWSRDGARILFGSYRNGPLDLMQIPADGSTAATPFLESEIQKVPADWSSDGGLVLVTENSAERRSDVVAYAADGTRMVVAATDAEEFLGRFSPDDKWVAYASDESGRLQIYVQPFPPTGAKWQITTEGGTEPQWRADGREIFYLDAVSSLMSVVVETATIFRHAPTPLFRAAAAASGGGAMTYAVAADGRRFLIRERVGEPPTAPIHVVLNWPALLAAGAGR